MSAADRIAEALLRLAARRWPAEVRSEQAREWAAELHALRTDRGSGAVRRAVDQLRFAFSLAAASPVEDEYGVPRGWREGLPAVGRVLRPVLALVLFGVVVVGPVSGVARSGGGWVLGMLGVHVGWPAHLGVTAATCLPALLIVTVAAWSLGRRMPLWRAPRRLGLAGSAAVAPVALAAAFAVLVVGRLGSPGTDGTAIATSLAAAVPVWILLSAVLGVAVVRLVVRGRRWRAATLALAGTPLVVELATAAAVLPATQASGAGPLTALAWAPALVSGRAWSPGVGSWYQSPDAVPLFNATNTYPVDLLLLTGLALAYGLGAARPRRPKPDKQPDKQPDQRPEQRPDQWRVAGATPRQGSAQASPIRVLPVAAVAAGVVALLAGLLSWAYTLAVLTPAMPLVGRSAPMPGGDGELYMWVAELRWASIMLAALGLLLTAADRPAALLAAVMQTVALLAADGILARSGAAGAAGLRIALGVSAVAAALAWWMAGAARRRSVDVLTVRRSLAGVAVTAACCGPILFVQGTVAVNHPYLPTGLAGVTAIVPATLAIVAGTAAAAARPGRLSRWWLTALVIGPAALLGACGAATGARVPYETTTVGVLLSAPMTVMVIGAMWARRPRRRWATATVWAGLVLASPLMSIVVVVASLMLSTIVANILFAVAGSSWQADGLSLLPGAVLVAAPLGVLVARKLIHSTEPPSGSPVPTDGPPDPFPTGVAEPVASDAAPTAGDSVPATVANR